jgi:glycosyltransferase involved in cell wall biosynthesis
VTVLPNRTPRALALAASVLIRHAADDPVRAVVLATRVLPPRLRGPLLRLAGPYGRAATLWAAGERSSALASLQTSPARLAAFSLAVDQPQVARSALARLPGTHRARARLQARLARREGQLTEALRALDGIRGGRLRRILRAELDLLNAPPGGPGGYGGPRGVRGAGSLPQGDMGGGEPPVRRGGLGGIAPPGQAGPILHIVTDALPTTNAGYTVRTQEIAVAQRAQGLDPHVVTRIGFPVTTGKLDARALVNLDGVPYHRLLPWVLPQYADKAARLGVEWAARLVEELRPAVLHAASNYANGLIGLALRDRYGIPLVYEVRGFWEDTWLSRHPGLEDLSSSEIYSKSRGLETRCMTEADLVVTLGEAMRDEIISRGIDPDRVLIVPNGVGEDFLTPLPDGAGLRRALGIAPAAHVIGLVSSLVAHEGIGTLLVAAQILRSRDFPVTTLIVGDGPERAALERQAAELGIDAVFTGRVPPERVRDYHAILDVFVVPRTPDRVCQLVTPLKPVEAMASGLPVVVSDVAALAELVTDGTTGVVFTPQDPDELAARLQALLIDPGKRRELGANARERVARDRTWAHNARRYHQAYAHLTGGTAPTMEGHK